MSTIPEGKREYFIAVELSTKQVDGERPIDNPPHYGKKYENLEDVWQGPPDYINSLYYPKIIAGYRVSIDTPRTTELDDTQCGNLAWLPKSEEAQCEYLGLAVSPTAVQRYPTILPSEDYTIEEAIEKANQLAEDRKYESQDFHNDMVEVYVIVPAEECKDGLWNEPRTIFTNLTDAKMAMARNNNPESTDLSSMSACRCFVCGEDLERLPENSATFGQAFTGTLERYITAEPTYIHIPETKWHHEEFFKCGDNRVLQAVQDYVYTQAVKEANARNCESLYPGAHLSAEEKEYYFADVSYKGPLDITKLRDLDVCKTAMSGFAYAVPQGFSAEMHALQAVTQEFLSQAGGSTLKNLPILWNCIAKHMDPQHPETIGKAIHDGIQDFLPYTNETPHRRPDGSVTNETDRINAQSIAQHYQNQSQFFVELANTPENRFAAEVLRLREEQRNQAQEEHTSGDSDIGDTFDDDTVGEETM